MRGTDCAGTYHLRVFRSQTTAARSLHFSRNRLRLHVDSSCPAFEAGSRNGALRDCQNPTSSIHEFCLGGRVSRSCLLSDSGKTMKRSGSRKSRSLLSVRIVASAFSCGLLAAMSIAGLSTVAAADNVLTFPNSPLPHPTYRIPAFTLAAAPAT